MQQRFETGIAPHVEIGLCQGDLVTVGWRRSAVEVSGDGFTAEMAELDRVKIGGEGALELTVPAGASLTLGEVHGSIKLRHLDGHVTIRDGQAEINLNDLYSVKIMKAQDDIHGENINGPLTIGEAKKGIELRSIADLQVARADGAVAVQFATGFVALEEISGKLDLHTIGGDVTVKRGRGGADLSNLGGRISLPDIEGDIRLNGGLASGEHQLVAAGNILVRWPVDAPLSLSASAPLVRCQLTLVDRFESIDNDKVTTLAGHIEEGQAQLRLASKNKIGIKPVYGLALAPFDPAEFDFDFEAMAEQPVPQAALSAGRESAPAAPTTANSPGRSIETELTARIETDLSHAGIQMAPAELHRIVAAAVAACLAELPADSVTDKSGAVAAIPPSTGLQAADKARRATVRSLQRARESIDKAREKSASARKIPTKVAPPTPPPEPASPVQQERMATEEQLHILKLLKDGLISVDQANLLLRAIEQ